MHLASHDTGHLSKNNQPTCCWRFCWSYKLQFQWTHWGPVDFPRATQSPDWKIREEHGSPRSRPINTTWLYNIKDSLFSFFLSATSNSLSGLFKWCKVFAAAASEPEANERGSSLISRRLHYRGLQSLFVMRSISKSRLTKGHEIWSASRRVT